MSGLPLKMTRFSRTTSENGQISRLSRASPGECEDDPDNEYIWNFIAYFDYRDSMDHKTVFCPTLNPGELFFL